MDLTPILISSVVWISSAAAAILLVNNRGEDLVVWAPLSVAFGPIALMLAYFRAGETCPYCFGRIHKKAVRCPHCSQDISLRDELVFARQGSSDHFLSEIEREERGAKVSTRNSARRSIGSYGSSNKHLDSYFFLAALYVLMILLGAGWMMVFLLNLE